MAQPSVLLPRVTLNMITSPQKAGLMDQRALIVGQISPGVRARGAIRFASNPANNDTITLGGTAWTFKTSGAVGSQVNLGGTLALTMTALATALNASADTQTALNRYVATANGIIIITKLAGTSGNSYTLAASAGTVSAATMAGGVAASNTGVTGLNSSVPSDLSSIDTLFGQASHVALMARRFRTVNPITNLDVIALADNASGVCAYAMLALSGTATRATSMFVSVVSRKDHQYQVDINIGDTAATILTNLAAAVALDLRQPFVYQDDSIGTAYFEAVNAGSHANDWLLSVRGVPAGITATLTGWANGATDPSLTTVFNAVANIRYQTIVWPGKYGLTTPTAWINARFNMTNRVMDGRVISYQNVALATAKTNALAANSPSVWLLNNTPTSNSNYIGPHIPEAPDAIAAEFAAIRALRFETDVSISGYVATNAAADQFGGLQLASLPYFNTPLINCERPYAGTGYDQTSQSDAENHGVAVVGANDSGTNVIMGVVTTTYQFDPAGNADVTWKYAESIDTHSVCREYVVNNLRKRFEQSRMTIGDLIPNRDMANEALIRGYVLGLCQDLQAACLIVAGQAARQYIQDNMVVTLNPQTRTATLYLVYPQVSQLEVVNGVISFVWSMQ